MTHIDAVSQQYVSIVGTNSHIDKNSPHLRLTFEQIRDRKDYMRCDQYLADLLGSMKAIGWTFLINDIPAFCDKIGLSIRTFQRARRLLIDAGKLIESRLNRDAIEIFLVRDYDKLIAQDDTPIAVNDKPIAQHDQPIAVTPSKPAPVKEHSAPSDLLTDPLSDPLSLPAPTDERENLELFEGNGRPIAAFKDWLTEQGKKMPRAIANLNVWVSSMAKRDEWQSAFIEWRERSIEVQLSAVTTLSPSTDYLVPVERSAEELATLKATIARAKQSVRIAS